MFLEVEEKAEGTLRDIYHKQLLSHHPAFLGESYVFANVGRVALYNSTELTIVG